MRRVITSRSKKYGATFERRAEIGALRVVVDSSRPNVLAAVDATSSNPDFKIPPYDGYGKFPATGWNDARFSVAWNIEIDPSSNDDREIVFLPKILLEKNSPGAARIVLKFEPLNRAPDSNVRETTASLEITDERIQWDRLVFPRPVQLSRGAWRITLQVVPIDATQEIQFGFFSVELIRPEVGAAQQLEATKLRADTTRFQETGFGVMVHWTAQSEPLNGRRLDYEEAVRRFDVPRFVRQVKKVGAKFVVFTTSHALIYFPGPNEALDKILPGRTASRDLIAELADELNKNDVQLFLYCHLGSGADPEWRQANGFLAADSSRLFSTGKPSFPTLERVIEKKSRTFGSTTTRSMIILAIRIGNRFFSPRERAILNA